jgi:hypothetical protein
MARQQEHDGGEVWGINTSNKDNEEDKEKRKAFLTEWNHVNIKQVSLS